MSHPKISREEKQQVIVSILEGKVEDEVTGFVRLIVEETVPEELFASENQRTREFLGKYHIQG